MRPYALAAALALPALAIAVAVTGLPRPEAAGPTPAVSLVLQGIQAVTGLAPARAAGLLGLATGGMVAALLAPRPWALVLALPGLALGLAAGPGEALLCLCGLGLARAMLGLSLGQDLPALIGCGFALGLMPLVHPAGIALTLSALPLLAACLPAPLIAGQATAGTALILGVPALGLPLVFSLLAWRHALPMAMPTSGAGGPAGAALPALAPALALAVLALLPLGERTWRRRLTTGALIALPPIALLLHGWGGGAVTASAALAPAFTLAGLIEARHPATLAILILAVGALAAWAWSCALP